MAQLKGKERRLCGYLAAPAPEDQQTEKCFGAVKNGSMTIRKAVFSRVQKLFVEELVQRLSVLSTTKLLAA